MCEIAHMLADGVGLPTAVRGLLGHLTERWDGRGPLRRGKGDAIPLPMQIAHVAVDATLQRLLGGEEHAARLIRERAGRGLDPQGAACFADDAEEILAFDPGASAWGEVLTAGSESRPAPGQPCSRCNTGPGAWGELRIPRPAVRS
jgi:hypothetical protein